MERTASLNRRCVCFHMRTSVFSSECVCVCVCERERDKEEVTSRRLYVGLLSNNRFVCDVHEAYGQLD
jgi:hypothetical protein